MLLAKTNLRTELALAAAALLAAGIGFALHARAQADRVGLFTSLPILWAETDDVRGLLNKDQPPHWAKAALQARGEIVPLDSLADGGGRDRLADLPLIVMAQPRPLSPAENVALDRWLRGGGKLLLLADPALTAETGYAIGDRRRPESVAMLSPILARWGLRLEFDDGQTFGERWIDLDGARLPVNLPGQLVNLHQAQDCRLEAGGIAAQCRIGKGRTIIIADAALMETEGAASDGARRAALDHLLDDLIALR